MIHFYLVLVEEPAQAMTMLFMSVPSGARVPGDYPAEQPPAGAAGQKA